MSAKCSVNNINNKKETVRQEKYWTVVVPVVVERSCMESMSGVEMCACVRGESLGVRWPVCVGQRLLHGPSFYCELLLIYSQLDSKKQQQE